ncbi:AbrB/MazE/SpoVT family DNA-binding domain-containing protein [Candidatus Peregrinibacteria bacterium]|nr:AbrB/MazE/SpoVT family DNA-binding domain-containing protein [Candidatus Peregrinibacteria bacterium]
MKTNVRQWGNSIGVRIPHIFAKEAGIVEGTELEMNLIDNKIVLSKPRLNLNELLSQVTADNLHAETDTGFVNGNEEW